MSLDINSPTWYAVSHHIEEELKRLRLRNDDPKLTEQETAAIRGEINACKRLLALPNVLSAAQAVNGPLAQAGGDS